MAGESQTKPPPPSEPIPGLEAPKTTHEPFPLIAKIIKLIKRP